MKRFIITLLILPFVSCNDFLDEVPKSTLSETNFYTTLEEAEAAVYAIYSPIRYLYSSAYLVQIEIPADYAYGRGSTINIGGEYTGLDATNIGRITTLWDYFYRAINYANIAIERISDIEADDSAKNELAAEARFLRAFCYFHLVRGWGAVPLRLDTKGEDIGRTPIADVYEAIISDLQVGENDLPSTPLQYGRPTKWAAKSLLAEVYLTKEDWSLAAEKAKEVIDGGLFSLIEIETAEDFDNIFGASLNGTTEEIFYIKYSHEDGTKWPYYFAYTNVTFTAYAGYVLYSDPENPFMKEWNNNDLRKQWNVFTEYEHATTGEIKQLPSSTPMCFSKYRDTGAPDKNNHANDYPVLRYTDILLIYAEAASQAANGPTADAIECLNRIKRRGYGYSSNFSSSIDYPTTGWTAESFQDSVLLERAYEFMCDGKRWLDLKRTGTVQKVILAHKGKVVSESMLLWPIPEDEINTNPLITQEDQNPGY